MIKKYFLRANTAYGIINLTNDNLRGISDIIILKGVSSTAKNRLLTRLAFLLTEKGKMVEGVMSPFDVGAYEGVIIREDGFAVFDEACSGKVIGEELSLDAYLRGSCEIDEAEQILLTQKVRWAYDNLYKSYHDAKLIHDEWEKIYTDNMDFERLNCYCENVIAKLSGKKKSSLSGERRTGFFGASTVDGAVNYIDKLTEDIKTRYFIKGRPGSGKSTFLKKLAAFCEKNGYNTEVYYCSLDKNSLDMVIVRELSLAVFDATPPHEKFPTRSGDGVLDFYTEAGLFGVDEKFSDELEFISGKYANKITQALAYLRLARCFETELEFYFSRMIDENGICIAADKIIRRIL